MKSKVTFKMVVEIGLVDLAQELSSVLKPEEMVTLISLVDSYYKPKEKFREKVRDLINKQLKGD